MSHAAYLTWDPDTKAVPLDEWLDFTREHGIEYVPNQIGRNGFCVYGGGYVSLTFGEPNYDELPRLENGAVDFGAAEPAPVAYSVVVSTAYGNTAAIPTVAALAAEIWRRWGGALKADREVADVLTGGWWVKQREGAPEKPPLDLWRLSLVQRAQRAERRR